MNVKKIIASLVLLCVVGFIAYCVKDVIDRQYPDYARPKVTVTADGQDIPVTVAGYQWDFALGGTYHKEPPIVYDIKQTAVETLRGGERLEITFSQPVRELTVNRSESYSYNFSPTEDDMIVPYESGGYLYELDAVFDNGWIKCYFYIIIN